MKVVHEDTSYVPVKHTKWCFFLFFLKIQSFLQEVGLRILECCYAVFGVLWVVARVLLCGCYAVFRIMGFTMLLCSF